MILPSEQSCSSPERNRSRRGRGNRGHRSGLGHSSDDCSYAVAQVGAKELGRCSWQCVQVVEHYWRYCRSRTRHHRLNQVGKVCLQGQFHGRD